MADDDTTTEADESAFYLDPGSSPSPRMKAAFEELSAALAEVETGEVAGYSFDSALSVGLSPMSPDALKIFGIKVGGGGGGGGGTGPIDVGPDCSSTLVICRRVYGAPPPTG